MPDNEGNNQDQGNFLFGGRIVPVKREGNVVYARTLRRGEKDTGETIHLEPGEQLSFLPGAIEIDLRDIDEYYNPKGLGGYRPVANTVLTWHRFATEQLGFFLFFFSLENDGRYAAYKNAVKLDISPVLKRGTRHGKTGGYLSGKGTSKRNRGSGNGDHCSVGATGWYVTLSRNIVQGYKCRTSVKNTRSSCEEMRYAFEHIDERATEGKVGEETQRRFSRIQGLRVSCVSNRIALLSWKTLAARPSATLSQRETGVNTGKPIR